MNEIEQEQNEAICSIIHEAFEPPPKGPQWKWWEENIWLDKTSPAEGKYSTALFPPARIFANWTQNPRTRRLVCIVAAQSTKTQNCLNLVMYRSKARPCTMIWIMASKDSVDEFKKKRVDSQIENCATVRKLLLGEHVGRHRSMVRFASHNLLFRGSNSRVGLQSDPAGLIICDERREWKKGAIEIVRKRLRAYSNALEVSCGTAGIENDDLHLDWKDGSQGFIHWYCPECKHSQPFRFGRKESPFWPEPRNLGGIQWSEDAKVNGEWNKAAVIDSARYQCEKCGEKFANHQKLALMDGMHEFHNRPDRLPELPSLHWSSAYMPWASCSFGEIAWEMLMAKAKLEYGNIQPMIAFQTETLGEPWREEGESVKPHEILERKKGYKMGERWEDDGNVESILTADRQQGFIVAIDRQRRYGGASRLIRPLRFLTFDDMRAYQIENKIKDAAVFIDIAWDTVAVAEACLKYGWNAMLGDDAKEFTRMVYDHDDGRDKAVKAPWRLQEIDPFVGTGKAGRCTIKRITWSKDAYRERLFKHVMRGTMGGWDLPCDIEKFDEKQEREWRYLYQMGNVEQVPILAPNGETVGHEWREKGRHDYPDCELENEVAADVCGLTRTM